MVGDDTIRGAAMLTVDAAGDVWCIGQDLLPDGELAVACGWLMLYPSPDNPEAEAKDISEGWNDFKGVGASVEWSGEKLLLKASAEERVKAVLEVLEQKFIKRGVSLRSLDSGEPYASGKEYRIEVNLKNGISSEDAKKVAKIIRDEGPKSVKAQIQGDELRVQSKSRDDLQATMALLKGKDLDVDLQFVNFR